MKVVVTDGIVTSMNLKVNEKTGNRVIWIEPLDANYGFDDEDMPESTPIWVPSHVTLDFGVGSDIVVIGRTIKPKEMSQVCLLTENTTLFQSTYTALVFVWELVLRKRLNPQTVIR